MTLLTSPWLAQAQQPDPTASLPHNWIQPVAGKITNPFGNSYHYFQIYRGGHTGVDISAPRGTPIKAVAAGKVVRIFQKPNQRYGQYIVLQHGPKLFSLYGHLSVVQVKLGQQIKQGELIAKVGTTGAAGYPHLHLEDLNRLPSHDGAWGYLYICRSESERASFINQQAFVISAIQRQRGPQCQQNALKETLTYYNPEALWSKKLVLREVHQPENEEWRRYRRPAQTPAQHARSSAVARPTPSYVPTTVPPSHNPHAAAPDKTAAPGESSGP
ncbi:MAG: M23 family metallopeptidase [Candidatus Sericytochromatia bacterium]